MWLPGNRRKRTLRQLKRAPRYHAGRAAFPECTVDYTDALSVYYAYQDIFMARIYRFEALRPGPLIVDAGACIGLSVLYFKHVCPDARILAFEPDPSAFQALASNVKRAGLKDVQLVNAGLGSTEGEAHFYPDGADGGRMQDTGDAAPIRVRVVRLGDYLDAPVDLLKMNIEGMEGPVFEQIAPKLDRVREVIMEYHAFHDLPQSLGAILNRLDQKGFRYLVTTPPGAAPPLPFRMASDYRHFNLVYAKNMRSVAEADAGGATQ